MFTQGRQTLCTGCHTCHAAPTGINATTPPTGDRWSFILVPSSPSCSTFALPPMCPRTEVALTASGRWWWRSERTRQRASRDGAEVGVSWGKRNDTTTRVRCNLAFAFPIIRGEPHLKGINQTRTVTCLDCTQAGRSRQVAGKRRAGGITTKGGSRR